MDDERYFRGRVYDVRNANGQKLIAKSQKNTKGHKTKRREKNGFCRVPWIEDGVLQI